MRSNMLEGPQKILFMVSLLFIPIFPSFSCAQSTGLLPLSPTKAQRADMPRHPSNSFSLPFWAGLIRHSAFIFFLGQGQGHLFQQPLVQLHLLFPPIPLLSLPLGPAPALHVGRVLSFSSRAHLFSSRIIFVSFSFIDTKITNPHVPSSSLSLQ